MIKTELIGSSELIKKISEITPNVYKNLTVIIPRLTIEIESTVKANKLSGQVLKTKTGNLRRSITHQITQSENGIYGQVGTNVNYGLMHEFGFKGSETVRAHLRTIKMAWGKSISPRTIEVKQFTRSVDFPERSFLRTALKEMESNFEIEVNKAISGAIA